MDINVILYYIWSYIPLYVSSFVYCLLMTYNTSIKGRKWNWQPYFKSLNIFSQTAFSTLFKNLKQICLNLPTREIKLAIFPHWNTQKLKIQRFTKYYEINVIFYAGCAFNRMDKTQLAYLFFSRVKHTHS